MATMMSQRFIVQGSLAWWLEATQNDHRALYTDGPIAGGFVSETWHTFRHTCQQNYVHTRLLNNAFEEKAIACTFSGFFAFVTLFQTWIRFIQTDQK